MTQISLARGKLDQAQVGEGDAGAMSSANHDRHGEFAMATWKLALLIWVIAGVTVAGIGVLVVVATPQLAANSAQLIPLVSAVGFVLAFVASWIVAKQINAAR